jgi:hypothetical protein
MQYKEEFCPYYKHSIFNDSETFIGEENIPKDQVLKEGDCKCKIHNCTRKCVGKKPCCKRCSNRIERQIEKDKRSNNLKRKNEHEKGNSLYEDKEDVDDGEIILDPDDGEEIAAFLEINLVSKEMAEKVLFNINVR